MWLTIPIGSMYAIYGNIYHQYTSNVSIYTIHGSYGIVYNPCAWGFFRPWWPEGNVECFPWFSMVFPCFSHMISPGNSEKSLSCADWPFTTCHQTVGNTTGFPYWWGNAQTRAAWTSKNGDFSNTHGIYNYMGMYGHVQVIQLVGYMRMIADVIWFN